MNSEMIFWTIFILAFIFMTGIRVYYQSKVLRDQGKIEIKEGRLSVIAGSSAALTSIVFSAEYIFFPGPSRLPMDCLIRIGGFERTFWAGVRRVYGTDRKVGAVDQVEIWSPARRNCTSSRLRSVALRGAGEPNLISRYQNETFLSKSTSSMTRSVP
jgi:hypothetical protein